MAIRISETEYASAVTSGEPLPRGSRMITLRRVLILIAAVACVGIVWALRLIPPVPSGMPEGFPRPLVISRDTQIVGSSRVTDADGTARTVVEYTTAASSAELLENYNGVLSQRSWRILYRQQTGMQHSVYATFSPKGTVTHEVRITINDLGATRQVFAEYRIHAL